MAMAQGHEEAEALMAASRERTWLDPSETYEARPPQLTARTKYQEP